MAKKIALITGASSGIGLELAKLLAKEAYDLILVARREDRLQVLATELNEKYGTRCDVLPIDLSRAKGPEKLWQGVNELDRQVDLLINNAGFGMGGEFHKLSRTRQESLIRLNVSALTMLCHYFGAQMVERRAGHVVNIASMVSFTAAPYMAVYAASKAYVLSFTEALSHEWREYGVDVTVICPGTTKTEFFEVAGADRENPKLEKMSMTAQQVAEQSLRAIKQKQKLFIPGTMNSVSAGLVKFLPRNLSASIMGRFMKDSI